MDNIGARVRELRKELKVTQEVFASRIGIKRNSVAQIEMGKHNPSGTVLRAICREFGISQAWLETGEGPKYIEQDERDIDLITRAMEGQNENKKKLIRILAGMPDELLDAMVEYLESTR